MGFGGKLAHLIIAVTLALVVQPTPTVQPETLPVIAPGHVSWVMTDTGSVEPDSWN